MLYLSRAATHSVQSLASDLTQEKNWFPHLDVVNEEELKESGENSRLTRLTLRNGESVILKRRPASQAARRVAAVQRWYEREVHWYLVLAPMTPIRCPRCFGAKYDKLTGAFGLALEDLSSWTTPQAEDLTAVLETLGKLHKQWNGMDKRGPLPLAPCTLSLAPQIEMYFLKAWKSVRADYDIHRDHVDIVDNVARPGVYVELTRRLAHSPRRTLLHGDFRPENLLVHEKEVCVLDWQFASVGAAAYDYAYFVALACSIDERRDFEPQLKAAYLHENPGGLPDNDVRTAVLLALASFVMGAFTAKDRPLHTTAIARLAAAAMDWGCDLSLTSSCVIEGL